MALQDWHPVLRAIVNLLRWIPVVFIFGVVCWSYYAYVVELCLLIVDNLPEKIAYLIIYHILLILFLWAYYQTIFGRMVAPPDYFKIPPHELDTFLASSKGQQNEMLERYAENLPILTRSYGEGVRFCTKCHCLKPDRAHHCAVCGLCLLKMDHHCPWVNACVHWGNYKFFVLFLGYALLYCVYIFLSDMRYFIETWRQDFAGGLAKQKGRMQVLFLFFVSGMFAASVGCLFFYHLWLVAKNRSTVEACYAPVFRYGSDKDGFNLGVRGNFRQVFGDLSLQAFLPVFTSPGDGIVYPTRRGAPVFDYKAVDNPQGGCSEYGNSPSNNPSGRRQPKNGSNGTASESAGDGNGNWYGLNREFRLNGVVVSGPAPGSQGNETANLFTIDGDGVDEAEEGGFEGEGYAMGQRRAFWTNSDDPLGRYRPLPLADRLHQIESSGDDSQDELAGHTYNV